MAPKRIGQAKLRTDGQRVWITGRAALAHGMLLVFVEDGPVVARDRQLSRSEGASPTSENFVIRLPDNPAPDSKTIRLFAVTQASAIEITVR